MNNRHAYILYFKIVLRTLKIVITYTYKVKIFIYYLQYNNGSHLYKKRVTKSQCGLKVLSEGVIQEGSLCYLALFKFAHYELCGLA